MIEKCARLLLPVMCPKVNNYCKYDSQDNFLKSDSTLRMGAFTALFRV